MNKSKRYQLNYLSEYFYDKYQTSQYPEIENKRSRPYIVILIRIDENTFAIPFRTNIKHRHCYKFKTSDRPSVSGTGLDYTKAVIINDDAYIGASARINDKEYTELDANFHRIAREFERYVRGYVRYISFGKGKYDNPGYKYTTLQYFHKELGIDK